MSESPAVLLVLGTRPEIIKLAPVVRELDRRDISFTVVHTGQHYSEGLTDVFFDRLGLPHPDYNLGVGSGSHGEQTGAMLGEIENVIEDASPSWVLVQGDTNSVLAGAVAASKMDTTLGHVEAGLRSGNREMPEEINRVLTDHAADHLFAPTERAVENLDGEGVDRCVTVTGNTVVDAVREHVEIASEESHVLDDHSLRRGEYIVLTAHRAENVDDPERFGAILDGLGRAGEKFGMPTIYPIHPRSRERIEEFGLTVPENVTLLDPLEYFDFLHLQRNAAVVVTDSGGVQEETCVLQVPCVTVREETERPETVAVGANRLAEATPAAICDGVAAGLQSDTSWENPFGDGDAAAKIVDVMLAEMEQ